MKEFIAKHQAQILGVLSGFDRLVFRGTLRGIAYGHAAVPESRAALPPWDAWRGGQGG
jgi:hypothetical protein